MYNPLKVSKINKQIEDLQKLKTNYQNIGCHNNQLIKVLICFYIILKL